MLLEAARHSLDIEWTQTLAAAEAAADHDVLGYPSTVAYLKDRLRMAGGRANRYVRNARSAVVHMATFAAWKIRQISADEAELLFRAADKDPDRYEDAETHLLELVGDGVEETRRVLDYWRNDVDLPGVKLDLEVQSERRRFEMRRRHNGMVEGSFMLPSLEGESLLSAIDTLTPPPDEGDGRTTTQRRADALGDLARAFLDGSAGSTVGGERPHINVHVDIPSLRGRGGGLHETADGFVVDPFTVSQLACEASVVRIVFGPGSEVLDVGRKTRVIPSGLRRGVVARDRHCVAPGCSRWAGWCDIHHIVPWAEGGETELDNLCLLCRYHHTKVHLDQLTLDDLGVRQLAGAVRDRST